MFHYKCDNLPPQANMFAFFRQSSRIKTNNPYTDNNSVDIRIVLNFIINKEFHPKKFVPLRLPDQRLFHTIQRLFYNFVQCPIRKNTYYRIGTVPLNILFQPKSKTIQKLAFCYLCEIPLKPHRKVLQPSCSY